MPLRLGKRPFTRDERDFQLAALAEAQPLPTPPARFGHGLAFEDWLMLGNGPDDTVGPGFQGCGDCVFAGADHETMLTNKLAGRAVRFTGREAIADYAAVTGYVLGDESTDRGTDVRQALAYRRKTGVVDAAGRRHRIGAYVSIAPKDWDELMAAVYVFTCVGIGLEFPPTAMEQFDRGDPWDLVDPDEEPAGGHYVPALGRNARSTAVCVSWGRRQAFTRAFYERWNDEAWALVFPEELRNGRTERGYTVAQLDAMLAALE